MADSFTDNTALVLQVTGENLGTWGVELNNLMIAYTDALFGSTLPLSVASSNVNLTTAQRRNLAFRLTGLLTTNITITFPLSVNSGSAAIGGFAIFDNQTTGNFSVTVKTVASGSTGVTVPQNRRSLLYSDTTNIAFATDGTPVFFTSGNGDPNGVVSGTAGTATTPASVYWDYTNHILYVSGGGTVWYAINPGGSTIALPLSIANGGTSQVTAQLARGTSGLNIDNGVSTSFNAASAIAATTRQVLSSATAMTASRILTLPAANTLTAGQSLEVRDMSGVVGTYTITLQGAGSDAVNSGTSVVLSTQYGGYNLISDGSAKWSAESLLPNAGAYTASGGIVLTGTNFTLDTNNQLGVGCTLWAQGEAVAWGLAAGSALNYVRGNYVTGDFELVNPFGAIPGIWRNITGVELTGLTSVGMWMRVS